MSTAIAPAPRPHGPYGLVYIRLAVPDIEATTAFYTEHVGLDPVEVSPERVRLRNDTPHHCVELRAAPALTEAATLAVGFTVESPEVLGQLADRIAGAGHERHPLDPAVAGLCTDGFGVDDPNGLRLELIHEFQEWAEPPIHEVRPADIVHPFLSTAHFDESLAFYIDVLGFQASDYIADQTAFLRSENRYHHSLALRRDSSYYVAHVCFMMKNFDHMMRARARAIYRNVPIPADIVNHSASHSIAFYMHDPAHGPRAELCDGHRVLTIDEHEHTHRARRMAVDPRNIDVWRAAADDWGRF